jgi:hypothetical protein
MMAYPIEGSWLPNWVKKDKMSWLLKLIINVPPYWVEGFWND